MHNQAQHQGLGSVLTFMLVVAAMLAIFIPAAYYYHIDYMPTVHHLIDQLQSKISSKPNGTAP